MAEKKKISWLMLLPIILFGGLATMFMWGMSNGKDARTLPSTREGGVVPALTVSPLGTGVEFTQEDLTNGGVKLVNFWASWCAPCRVEHPQLETLAREGVTIYGINYKDEDTKALRFLEELGNPYVSLMADKKGRTGLDWGLYGVPETFVIDKDGVVIKRFAGPITESILDSVIRPAITEAEASGS
ncbi:DsbE family thiol:disulfide interchange protein [Aliiroseovarius sp. KMU-50]|uniref:DsbE family thiol:disulfide interchange protein n=1 Tax=Aliiroseovarius salicola TaxID=3009082 RepID=A0ABT4W043_9RHOB|nr:DsbE family thiol:disulfide interchange protein [Aliiroseovarius sp. KMU-50]MDA5093883.1 DsbE family thiol:disulfide interchange protein [Aliiroseovarius sp. KMU-50]